jgi:hypothetical protein
VQIGHINLAKSFNGTGEHFVSLVESLRLEGVDQHVVVRNMTLARRLHAIDKVVVGPVVRSPITAYCMMPHLDLVHIHDSGAGQAGLLLTLTRSIPFVMTHRGPIPTSLNPLTQAVYRRAASIICLDESELALLHHYDPLLRVHVIPDIERSGSAREHLRVYQNSQRIPIAGSNGIQ